MTKQQKKETCKHTGQKGKRICELCRKRLIPIRRSQGQNLKYTILN